MLSFSNIYMLFDEFYGRHNKRWIAALNTPFRKSPMVKVKQRVQPFDDKILLTLIQTSRRKTKYKHVQKSTSRYIKFPEKDLKVENLKLKRNWTSQLVEPLSSLNNSWRSFFFGAELVNTIIILFKPSPFFNRYLTSSISSFWPPRLKISIFLTRINKHWGAQCGSIHLKLKFWLKRKQTSDTTN